MRKPFVIVEVSGGVAEVTHCGDNVEVVIIDWDNLEGGGSGTVEDALSQVKRLRRGEAKSLDGEGVVSSWGLISAVRIDFNSIPS